MEAKRSSSTSLLVFCTIASCILGVPIFVLSVFNFGLISRWYNGGIAILTIVYGAAFFFFKRRERIRLVAQRAAEEATAQAKAETVEVSDGSSIIKVETDVTAPWVGTPPTPTSATPTFELDSDLEPIFPLSNSVFTIIALIFFSLAYLIAFAIMMDITVRGGAKSTLPAEREPGMNYPWNIKVQIGQTAVIGVQMLVMGVCLTTSYLGRLSIARVARDRREMVENGFDSSEVEV